MKKSKIIIPALGVLALSTAASITGTVAWFTANRTATITTDAFALVNVDGNLDVELTAGIGTDVSNGSIIVKETKRTIETVEYRDEYAKLGQASFNPETKQLYKVNKVDGAGKGVEFEALGDGSRYNTYTNIGTSSNAWYSQDYKASFNTPDRYETYHVYYAFTWQARLKYTWGADHSSVHVLLDYGTSVMTPAAVGGGSASDKTSKAFRLGMFANSKPSASGALTDSGVVWAGLSDKQTEAAFTEVASATAEQATAYNNRYGTSYSTGNTLPAVPANYLSCVSGVAEANQGNYGSATGADSKFSYLAADYGNLGSVNASEAGALDHSTYTKVADRTENIPTTRADYIGTINYSTSEKTEDTGASNYLDVNFVAWFEGTDPRIINMNKAYLEEVASTIKLYTALDNTIL